ncbi:MAG: hypothetical protein JWM59_3961 [Verrucomicrobiales bacterium]|nr:hypothetical protein [Verrucomicrobiales bacterium]
MAEPEKRGRARRPCAEHPSAQPAGKVVSVHDGDTITVYPGNNEPQIKVRLAGINAPELEQAYSADCKATLSAMVFGKPVELPRTSKDRYGWTIATVIVDGALK